MSKKYLDLEGLSTYDQKIKEYIGNEDDAVEEQVADLKSAASETNGLIGNIEYWGTPNSYTSPNTARIAVTQKRNAITCNNSSATAETTSIKQRYYRLNDGIAFMTQSDFAADTRRLALKEGHEYRFLVKKLGGSVTGSTDTTSLRAFIYDSNTSTDGLDSPALVSVKDLIDEEYHDFTGSGNVNVVLRTSNGILCTNLVLAIYLIDLTESGKLVDIAGLESEIEGKLDATYDEALDWSKVFGDADYPLGWSKGYYNASGDTGASNDVMRTNSRLYYTARTDDIRVTLTVPAGKHAAIVEYDENGANGVRYGGYSSGGNVCTVNMTAGHRYKFCLGEFDGDAEDYITAEFLATVTAVVSRSMMEWQKEADKLLTETNAEIPEYYTDGSNYLATKLGAITELQRTLPDKTDSFLFISDYHTRTNQGHSLALLKEIASRTGIQKLFFAGDAGGRLGSSGSGYHEAFQKSVKVWSDLSETTEAFWGVLGNHEWIYHVSTPGNVDSYSLGAMYSGYLNRFKQRVQEMADSGSYYIDDTVSKIRYYFLQDSYGASALDFDWFGHSLEDIDDGYYIAVIAHHGYIPGRASMAEYDGVYIQHSDTVDGEGNPDELSASHVYAKTVSRILNAYQTHTALSVTISSTAYSWDFTGSVGGGVIGVFCGHYHHGTLFAIGDQYNDWDVTVWRAGTDSLQAGSVFEDVDGQKVPWYWANGTVGGTKVIRASGTTDEQCFYAVQIDLTAKKVYITAIGGDHDWEFSFT